MMSDRLLVVILGPTGCGKSDIAIKLAQKYATHIISADSRQMYRELAVGSAPPSAEQLQKVKHHFHGL